MEGLAPTLICHLTAWVEKRCPSALVHQQLRQVAELAMRSDGEDDPASHPLQPLGEQALHLA